MKKESVFQKKSAGEHLPGFPFLISSGLSIFIVLCLSAPVFFSAPGALFTAKLAWIFGIGFASYRVFRTGSVSKWRSLFFIILAWAFILEFKSTLIGLSGSAWVSPEIQEVPYCHIAIASTLLNHLYHQYLAVLSGHWLKWSPLAAGLFFWLLATLSIGQGWCSWACFYGGLDTTFSSFGKKPLLKWFHLPRGIRDFSLALLITVLVLSLVKTQPIYCLWGCPLKISTGFLDPDTAIRKLQLAIFAVAGILFIIGIPLLIKKRTFCTFLCPFGAWQALVGRISPFRVSIRPDLCTLCGQCLKACPVYAIDAEGVKEHKISSYCNRCGDCFDACPTGAIDYTIRGLAPGTPLPRILFLVSAWLIGGSVSLLFVPSAMLKGIQWIASI